MESVSIFNFSTEFEKAERIKKIRNFYLFFHSIKHQMLVIISYGNWRHVGCMSATEKNHTVNVKMPIRKAQFT